MYILLYLLRRKNIEISKTLQLKYLFLFIPALLFFFVAGNSSPYVEERYTSAIYALMYAGVFCVLFSLLYKLLKDKTATIISVVLIVFVSVMGLATNNWQYLYLHEKENFDKLKEYAEYDCIAIYSGESYRLNSYIIELTSYNSLAFVRQENIAEYDLEELVTTDKAIICLAGIFDDSYMDTVMEYLPSFSGYEYIAERSFCIYK